MNIIQGKEIALKNLVRKAQKGDARAFIELMDNNRQSMYKIARSFFSNEEDIADAIQDTIEICYRSLSELKQAEYFRTWLARILINKCKAIMRKNKRECPVEALPEQGQICIDLKNCEFENLMSSLDEKYRTVLLLYYGEGFKIREIAQLLNMEESTVKNRLARGREKFRRAWTEADGS